MFALGSYRRVYSLLASLHFAILLSLLSPSLSSEIFQQVMAQHQHNMVVVNVAFPSLISSDTSTLINNNSSSPDVIPVGPNNFSLYNNSTYGIQFQAPNGWNKIEALSGRTTLIDFTFHSRNASGGVQPAPHVAISIEKGLGNVTTLQEYSEAADKLLNKILGNSTTTARPITLSGLPAISKIIATKHPTSGIGISIAQVFTIKNNNAYSITYTVPTTSYYRYLPVVQQILNSFQIADKLQSSTPPPITGAGQDIAPPPPSTTPTTPPTSNTPATTSPTVPSEPECVPGFHWASVHNVKHSAGTKLLFALKAM